MRATRRHSLLIACVAAVALFALEAIALAHDVEHTLGQHDEAACALHLYLGYGASAAADAAPAIVPVFSTHAPIPATGAAHTVATLGYRGRAPPSVFIIRPIPG